MPIRKWSTNRLRSLSARVSGFFPTFYRAYPTLRGLKLEKQPMDGLPDLIPWSKISLEGSSYLVVTETGEKFRTSAGRKVVISISDPYKKAIANKAMRRWIRTGLRKESVRFADSLLDLRWFGLLNIVLGLALVMESWETILGAISAIGGSDFEFVPDKFRPLLLVFAILTSLFWVAILSFAIGGGMYAMIRPQPKRIQITGTNLISIDRNGTSRTFSLKDLISVGAFGCGFIGGYSLELLLTPPRIRMALREALELFGPKFTQGIQKTNSKWARFARTSVFTVLAAICTYFLVEYFSLPEEDIEGHNVSGWSASLVILAFGLLHAIAISPIPANYLKGYHRKSMKKRRRRGLCLKCGYNLTGAPEPRCPECGTTI